MFEGTLTALITPFRDGEVDEPALRAIIERQIEAGIDGLVPCGSTGESATLSYAEHHRVVEITIEAAAGRVPVIAGTGSNSTREAIDITQHAKEAGADGALLLSPYYNKPTQEGLYLHHRAVAEAVSIPQILYNVPGRTAVDMLPATVERLAAISNIIGIKEATGNLARGQEILDRCGDRLDLYSGDDATAMELILMGAKGDISVTANVAPRAMHEMCAAALRGDRAEAERLNAGLIPLHEKLFLEANPIPVKWALQEMGLIPGGIRLPLTPLAESCREPLRKALQQAGVL